ncbi:3,4-dihydroxy-2-butanone-4-phosphate synthase [Periweissella cryptocerci]|uniref:3,4-dihydroxy-2-butanone 4-phosphate synthase n=1 Tax=Periweissella cryptocerci TaxID=2506420 RepID=A0A4P6YTY1_9LACO|nr:3,4-dihydroxy-2-butanone-4-phosphate synthase [Periweissella cryptocerci]QBO36228.1 3,4-dihydroxy-2-butanone-4-phosphate synthase [Periweissella cryptocerci]
MFNTIDEALATLRNGGYIVLADNENLENEGDLVALADRITPDTVNDMLGTARGLMCVAVSSPIATQLELHPMLEHSTDPNGTPFTFTIDGTLAATGVTTGVSAFDRAASLNKIAKPTARRSDFNAPGHIQPLIAQPGLLAERQGHTEGSVELARLAGGSQAAVIIEVLQADGHMMRRDGLRELADKKSVPFVTIEQIIAYVNEVETATAHV